MNDLINPPEHLQITYLSGAYDKDSPSAPTSWADVVAVFTEAHRLWQNFEKLEHPAFSPSSRPDDSRLTAQNVRNVHWMTWDLDHKTVEDLAEVRKWLHDRKIAHITHTTGSHGKVEDDPSHGRWRILAPLSAPVPAGLWKTVLAGINRASGGHADPACKDPCRLYFLPGWGPGVPDRGDRFLHVQGGGALDPLPFLQGATPTDLAQVEAEPVGRLELDSLAAKLTSKRDPESQAVGTKLRLALDGHSYGDPGEDPCLDLWRFRFARAIMDHLPRGDVLQIAKHFERAHRAIDPDPFEVERRQDELIAKLSRFQVLSLKMPEELADGNFGGNVVEGDSDLELARWVTEGWGSVIHSRGCFWRYVRDRGVWEARPEDAVWKTLETLDGALITKRKALFRLSERQGSSVAKAARLHTLDEHFFDRKTPGICFRNGFVTLAKDAPVVVEPHSPKNRAIFAVDEDWNAGATCPVWDQILQDVFLPDEDKDQKIAMLQEFAGAALGGVATQYAKALILLGAGSNGKSTILRVIGSLFPSDSTTAQAPHDWTNQSASYNLVALSRAAINLAPEVSEKSVGTAAIIKSVISGDPILARPIREMPFTFEPKTAHFFAMNELFSSGDNSRGFWRRFLICKFNRSFENAAGGADHTVETLVEQVQKERAGVYAWAFRGLQRLLAQGHYTTPESNESELTRWKEDNDPVAEWFAECWEAFDLPDGVPQASLPQGHALHQHFLAWCAANQVPEFQQPRRRKLSSTLATLCKVYTPGNRNHFALQLKDKKETP